MDFFAAQQAAKRRTGLLVLYFVLAVLGTAAVIWVGLSAVLAVQTTADLASFSFRGDLAVAVLAMVAIVTGAGAAFHAARLSDGGPAVARMLGGVALDRRTEEAGERRLVNVAEEMAIASGLPPPALYVLPGEDGINAFAAGLTPDRAVVAVTRGALDRLTRDELQGVVAHEYSHVLNGDARLNVRLLAVIGGITVLAAIGRILVRLGSDEDSQRSWSSSRGRRRGGAGAAILAVGIVLWIAGSVGAFFGRLIRAAVSRQREYLADAAAVQFTRNPDGLAGALAKIAQAGSRVRSALAPEAAHLFFANGLGTDWLATHPPIKDRIQRISPQGGYLRAMRLAQGAAEREYGIGEASGAAPDSAVAQATYAAVPGTHGKVPGTHGKVPGKVPATAGMPGISAGSAVPGTAGAAGAAGVPLTASALLESVGRPEPRHVTHASAILAALPPEVAAAARDPVGAAALVRAVLADSDPGVRAVATRLLPDADVRARVAPLAAALATLPRGARMAALGLALPALDELSAPDAAALVRDLAALAGADGRTSVFEWAVQRIVRRRLARQLGGPARPPRLSTLDEVQVDLLDLLSTIAWAGSPAPEGAQAALDTALPVLGISAGWRVLPREKLGARRLDAALDRLDGAVPPLKAKIVEACAAAVAFDGRVRPAEADLLRAVAASLGVPVPPILAEEDAPERAGAA
jgi:Zn-dependent protease with chaperone function